MRDRESEIDTARQRNIRQDIVSRYWGSEAELTKKAYNIVNHDVETPIDISEFPDINTLGELKNEIIRLKLDENRDENKLKHLLGALVNQVSVVKEALVIQKMNEMHISAT